MGALLVGPVVFLVALLVFVFGPRGAPLHGASHVDSAFFLSLVYLLVAARFLLEGPAQLVGVGVNSLSLLEHLFDLPCVRVDVQIEPNVFPVEKNDFSKNVRTAANKWGLVTPGT